jgi:hypothetical protein
MKYVISYDIGDPSKSLVIGNISIRSGGRKVFNSLPIGRSKLTAIAGVSVREVADNETFDYEPDNPKYPKNVVVSGNKAIVAKSGPAMTMRQRAALKTK